jgi:alkylhydroperoxidase/carboxymuconolactone decarboxylase family protein YurZ
MNPDERRSAALIRLAACHENNPTALRMSVQMCFRAGVTNEEIIAIMSAPISLKVKKMKEEFEDETTNQF